MRHTGYREGDPITVHTSTDYAAAALEDIQRAIRDGIHQCGGFTLSPAYRALNIARVVCETVLAGHTPENIAILTAEKQLRDTWAR